VDESTFGVHEIEFVVNAGEDFSNGGRVGDHADGTLDLGEVTSWDNGWWLVVDTTLETSWAPVDELDGSLGLDGGNSGVDVLRDDVTTVHHTTSHVFTVTRVALGHHSGRLESRVGDFSNGQLFVVGLFSRDDWGIRRQDEMNTWVWHQVSLELSDIDVQGTIESERSSQRRDDLSDQTVQVGVGWAFNVKRFSADVVDGFVVNHDSNISVLQKRVSGENRVVRLDNGGGNLRSWVDGETEFGFLTVVNGKTLQKERSETRSSTTTDSVEDEETLETSTVVSQFTDAVQSKVNNFLSNGVVTTGVVVGGIFLSGDQLLRVEKLTVGTGTNFVNDGWFEIQHNGTRDVFSSTSLREESVESIVTSSDSLVRRHLSIRLNTVLETVEFPAGVTDLDTGLSDVDGDNFTHDYLKCSLPVVREETIEL
jgi:hypothetical protein